MSFLNMGDPQITIGFNTILSAGWPIPLKNMSESQLEWWNSQYMEKQNMFHTTNQLWSNDLDDHYSQLSKSTRLCLLWDKKHHPLQTITHTLFSKVEFASYCCGWVIWVAAIRETTTPRHLEQLMRCVNRGMEAWSWAAVECSLFRTAAYFSEGI